MAALSAAGSISPALARNQSAARVMLVLDTGSDAPSLERTAQTIAVVLMLLRLRTVSPQPPSAF